MTDAFVLQRTVLQISLTLNSKLTIGVDVGVRRAQLTEGMSTVQKVGEICEESSIRPVTTREMLGWTQMQTSREAG